MTKTFKPACNRILSYYNSEITLPLDCAAIAADCNGRVHAFEFMPEFTERFNHWECPGTRTYYLGKFDAPLTVEESKASLWIANEFHFDDFIPVETSYDIHDSRVISINGIEVAVPKDALYIAADGDGKVYIFSSPNIIFYGDSFEWKPEEGYKILVGKSKAIYDIDSVDAHPIITDMEF